MSEAHHRVRWKEARHEAGRWRYGRVSTTPTVEADGSVRIYAEHHGGARSLDPNRVDYQGRGPRGGRRWLPITELIDSSSATAEANPEVATHMSGGSSRQALPASETKGLSL